MLNNITVRKKLFLLIAGGAVIALLISFAGLIAMNSLGKATEQIGTVKMPAVVALQEMCTDQNAVILCERGLINRRMTGNTRVMGCH